MDRVADKFSEIKKIVRKKIDGITVKKESISKSTKRPDGKRKLEDSEFKDSAQASTSSTSTLKHFLRQKVFKSENPGNKAEDSNTKTVEKVSIFAHLKMSDRSDSSTSGGTDITSVSEASN
ncbi:GSCOCT00014266001.2-RA-CDS [Cotesia congregata]|uniref:Cc_single_28.4 n=2 Tax=root TaxID=1 RepID=S6D2X9_COTCN|nr:GSCOCT00014266001.2-RA-CDS [Cotesia congregata]CAG5092466.1 cc_single_28.4 [Cotesia congregata]CCB96406.1 hypothetical protein CcBV_28.4 [Bracoviriform congregatae]CCQ71206.1 hypothetical protein CcBV_28.4 [Cotesia congregata]